MTFTDKEKNDIKVAKETLLQLLIPRIEQFSDELKTLLIEKGTLSGGASASIFHGGIPKDYDIYLDTQEDINKFNKMITEPHVAMFVKDVNEKYSIDVIIKGKLVTANAVTFNNDIQVITREVAIERNSFDFIHCMPYLNIKDKTYYISKAQYDSIKNKELRVNPKSTRLPQTFRWQKFKERGWS